MVIETAAPSKNTILPTRDPQVWIQEVDRMTSQLRIVLGEDAGSWRMRHDLIKTQQQVRLTPLSAEERKGS